MRLSEKESQAIIEGVSERIGSSPAKLFLYGSRVEDTLSGGDIDLLIVLPSLQLAQKFSIQTHYFLAAIKKRLGDQKIDLSIKAESSVASDDFWRAALAKAKLLNEWKGT